MVGIRVCDYWGQEEYRWFCSMETAWMADVDEEDA